MNHDRAYVSLLIRPDEIQPEQIPDTLADALETNAVNYRYCVKAIPPCILLSLADTDAVAAVNALRKLSCVAFAPTKQDLIDLGPTLKVKDMRRSSDGIVFGLWRNEETHIIQPDDIEVVIRAKMMDEKKSPTSGGASIGVAATAMTGFAAMSIAGGWGFGGSYGIAAGLYRSNSLFADSALDIGIRIHAKLDIHTKNGNVYQIDGDQFGFDILGEKKGYSDNVNIDQMCELFTKLSPNAAIDPYFKYFKPPPGHESLRIPNRSFNKDDPTFAFYSRWAALMYRYIAQSA